MKFKAGDKVKFTDDIWEAKQARGMVRGFFGPSLKADAENNFAVVFGRDLYEEHIEYQLLEFPFLVWEQEIELVEDIEEQIKLANEVLDEILTEEASEKEKNKWEPYY
jgi:hypothetical protein